MEALANAKVVINEDYIADGSIEHQNHRVLLIFKNLIYKPLGKRTKEIRDPVMMLQERRLILQLQVKEL